MKDTGLSFKSFAAVTGLSAVSIISGVWAVVEPTAVGAVLAFFSVLTGFGYFWYTMNFRQE